MKKFFITIPKVLFSILCYLSTLLLAILSAYFTITFYAQSQSGWNMWAMGGLAGMLEFIKIMLATAYPFMKYRDLKTEKKVSFYLKICFFLSVMASLNFFMSGGTIERSPASAITKLLYDYMPVLNIIPLSFSQFLTTISLSILVEAFIVFLPILAPIMFLAKDYDRKNKDIANTNMEKLKEIVTVIPNQLIDRLYNKVVKKDDIKVTDITEKPKLKLLKSSVIANNETEDKIKELEYNQDLENKNTSDSVLANKEEIELVRNAMLKHKMGNIAPSIPKIMEFTGLSKKVIQDCKRQLEIEKKIKTNGNKTFVLEG